MKRDPAGIPSHDFHNNNAMVAGRCRVHAIQSVRRDRYGSGKTEGNVRPPKIVVDGFRHADTVYAEARKAGRNRHGPVAPDNHQRIQFVASDILEALAGYIAELGDSVHVHGKSVRIGLVVCSQDGASDRQDVAHGLVVEPPHAILDQPQKAVFYPHNLKIVSCESRFRHSPYDRIQTGAVSACGHHTDSMYPVHYPVLLSIIL